MMSSKTDYELTKEMVDDYVRIKYQLIELHNDISILSKKNPNNPINLFKLNYINEKIRDANQLLAENFKPSKDFSNFDTEELPTASDVVFILSQYLDALEAWRSSRVAKRSYYWYWRTTDKTEIQTEEPSRYRRVNR